MAFIVPRFGHEKISRILVFTVLLVTGSNTSYYLANPFIQSAYADGLSFESLPPYVIAGTPISLFIKVEPQILTTENQGNESLQLRLFDPSSNETITHVTYSVHVLKDDKSLMTFLFHSHSGPLKLNIHPKEGPPVVLNGEKDPYNDVWTGTNDIFDVQSPMMIDGGLFHFQITIMGMSDDANVFEANIAPTFDAWLSIGIAFHDNISYNNETKDLTIISYYDKLKEFKYDPITYTISWSMPFDWNLDRIANQNIFVHEEVKVPKSFITFLNSTQFVATVNNIPLTNFAVAVDPYSSETEYIVHYIINKNAILQLAQIRSEQPHAGYDENLMSFSLSISTNSKVDQTSSELITASGIRVHTRWEPNQLVPNSESKLSIQFYDLQNGTGNASFLNSDVEYTLRIIDKNGTNLLERDNLVAVGGVDMQTITFPANDTYEIVVNVTGINRGGEAPDLTRNGIGTGVVVVPEFASSTVIVAVALTMIAIIFFASKHVLYKRKYSGY